MAFFWSGPNASIAGIFRRSARYWIVSYVGNCLWGPPGHRGVRNPNHPGHAAWKREQARQAVADWNALSAATKAVRLRRESHDMAARLGWSEPERRVQEAAMLWAEGVGPAIGGDCTARTVAKAQWKPWGGSQTHGAAVSRVGGLKGGARLCGGANRGGSPRGGGQNGRPAAQKPSGGLRGGATTRWKR